jgi:hypothetical protein
MISRMDDLTVLTSLGDPLTSSSTLLVHSQLLSQRIIPTHSLFRILGDNLSLACLTGYPGKISCGLYTCLRRDQPNAASNGAVIYMIFLDRGSWYTSLAG